MKTENMDCNHCRGNRGRTLQPVQVQLMSTLIMKQTTIVAATSISLQRRVCWKRIPGYSSCLGWLIRSLGPHYLNSPLLICENKPSSLTEIVILATLSHTDGQHNKYSTIERVMCLKACVHVCMCMCAYEYVCVQAWLWDLACLWCGWMAPRDGFVCVCSCACLWVYKADCLVFRQNNFKIQFASLLLGGHKGKLRGYRLTATCHTQVN